ncbi:alpha-amylase family glycosyl hydrolase [Actinoplanes sp. NPDC026623]|uniref:alpha-amylase family glycosyl hydrolase n=1 Tax=Actinoplanes sp. NPDC026623 TaxID=3155610 RepID=UPI0033EE7469
MSIRKRLGLALAVTLAVATFGFVAAASAASSVTVYYQRPTGWTTVNIHYAPYGGSWTAVPGVAMQTSCTGWLARTIDLGDANGLQVVFNNGSGVWDNNNGANYSLGTGDVTVAAGRPGTGNPCATSSPTPSAGGSPTATPAPTVTPTSTPGVPAGTPLGGDPREDSIYFVMTARFNDGDSANNRGGSQNVKSGNAAGNDPMFRGDFEGLIDKLDYIKGLGFSAIWITPVVLNRSDYDYHGYHGWDFYRIDGRLETAGNTYQDLIDRAHAKGIKIYQDVVYNHSSRWGAKGLFTPTVYGVRDAQWSWYYDQRNEGFAYDGSTVEPASGKSYYNGDVWSTTEPVGNTCLNWGKPTGGRSAEGYTLYNCQWPSPTSGMFPAEYYHRCWIGNWEGEDARSCWIHEDLADFNTESPVVQNYLINAYNRYIDMGVDGFRVDTAVHIPRNTWNRRFLPAIQQHAIATHGEKGKDFYVFGEVAAFVHDKWNRGSVNHSAQFFTWKERKEYSPDDILAAAEQFEYENLMGPGNQPTSTNAFLNGNTYHAPDHSRFSGMNVIDMRMHMNFGEASNAFYNGKDSDDSYNDATYNAVYVDSHDYGPNKSSVRYAGGTDAWAENMSLMWTFRGIPTLYYGSEIEFQAGKPIDCGPSCPLATTGRAYYGDHLAGSVTANDFGVVSSASGAVATTLAQPLVKHVQRLNQIRRAIPALQKGQYSTEGISGTMAFKRRFTSGGVDSFALVALSGTATFTGVPNGTYVDAITGASQTVGNGTLTATASGKGNLRIYVLNLPGNPAPGKVGTAGPYLK